MKVVSFYYEGGHAQDGIYYVSLTTESKTNKGGLDLVANQYKHFTVSKIKNFKTIFDDSRVSKAYVVQAQESFINQALKNHPKGSTLKSYKQKNNTWILAESPDLLVLSVNGTQLELDIDPEYPMLNVNFHLDGKRLTKEELITCLKTV